MRFATTHDARSQDPERLIALAEAGDREAAALLEVEARRRHDEALLFVALANGAPSRHAFGTLLWLVEQTPRPTNAARIAYAESRLASWPHHTRQAPTRWLLRGPDPEPAGARLVRAVVLADEALGADALNTLAADPMLRFVRELTVATSLFDATAAQALSESLHATELEVLALLPDRRNPSFGEAEAAIARAPFLPRARCIRGLSFARETASIVLERLDGGPIEHLQLSFGLDDDLFERQRLPALRSLHGELTPRHLRALLEVERYPRLDTIVMLSWCDAPPEIPDAVAGARLRYCRGFTEPSEPRPESPPWLSPPDARAETRPTAAVVQQVPRAQDERLALLKTDLPVLRHDVVVACAKQGPLMHRDIVELLLDIVRHDAWEETRAQVANALTNTRRATVEDLLELVVHETNTRVHRSASGMLGDLLATDRDAGLRAQLRRALMPALLVEGFDGHATHLRSVLGRSLHDREDVADVLGLLAACAAEPGEQRVSSLVSVLWAPMARALGTSPADLAPLTPRDLALSATAGVSWHAVQAWVLGERTDPGSIEPELFALRDQALVGSAEDQGTVSSSLSEEEAAAPDDPFSDSGLLPGGRFRRGVVNSASGSFGVQRAAHRR